MARSFDQVLSDVTAQSDPQRQTVLSQIADLPNQQAAQTAAIGAQKDQANEDILSSARQRGLGFSGIPIGEQAKYAATTYAPALANLATSVNNQKGTLEGALSTIGQNDYNTANGIFQQDRNFEEQQRQFNEQQALARQQAAAQASQQSSLAGLFGAGGNPSPNTPTPAQPSANMVKRASGGFNFTNQYGNAVSAAQYAALKGIPFRDLLGVMAQQGDAGAKSALGFVGNDFKYDPTKLNSQGAADLYNSLVWGTNAPQATYKTPAKPAPNNSVRTQPTSILSAPNPYLGGLR